VRSWSAVAISIGSVALRFDGGEPDKRLTPKLHEKAECRFHLDDQEMEFWLVSRLALERLLF